MAKDVWNSSIIYRTKQYEVIGLMTKTEFLRRTGCGRDYTSSTRNEIQLATAKAAPGELFYRRLSSSGPWALMPKEMERSL